jgi:hypothetical protein
VLVCCVVVRLYSLFLGLLQVFPVFMRVLLWLCRFASLLFLFGVEDKEFIYFIFLSVVTIVIVIVIVVVFALLVLLVVVRCRGGLWGSHPQCAFGCLYSLMAFIILLKKVGRPLLRGNLFS